jgi:hypothetical protein
LLWLRFASFSAKTASMNKTYAKTLAYAYDFQGCSFAASGLVSKTSKFNGWLPGIALAAFSFIFSKNCFHEQNLCENPSICL